MDVSVNYLAVLLAGLSAMVVGSLWYSPRVFYAQWAKLSGAKPVPGFTKTKMALLYGAVFVASLVTAYILAFLIFLTNQFFHNSLIQDALTTAFWVWVGFVASRFYVHDRFENRDPKLTALNAAHELATLLVMAVIIGVMGY